MRKVFQLCVVIGLLFSTGCIPLEPVEPDRYAPVEWEVLGIRITDTVETKSTDKSGDAAAGAAVGGLAFGGVGAVLGAAAGASGDVDVVRVTKASSCLMKVKEETGETRVMTFTDTFEEVHLLKMCSMAREGDRLKVIKNLNTGRRLWKGQFADVNIAPSEPGVPPEGEENS